MKKGFSLVEVLIVIIIIAILASLMLPVFRSSKASALKTVCVSNLHQLYSAIKLYQADYDTYPPNTAAWPGLQPYIKTKLRCPVSQDKNGIFDYILNVSPFGKIGDPRYKAWTFCQEQRGGDFPVIFDTNHLSRSEAGTGASRFAIFVRENGAVVTVPNTRKATPGPCNESIMGPFINK